MQDEHKSNKPTWIIIALLGSPVIVSLMDMTKEAIFGPKDKSLQVLEVALAELAASRRPEQIQEKQKIVYVPVPHPHNYIPQPIAHYLVHHTRFRPHPHMVQMMALQVSQPLMNQQPNEAGKVSPPESHSQTYPDLLCDHKTS